LEHGVDIHRETRISRVDLLSHTATDGQGAEYGYRKLVWAADLKEMYRVANLDALPEGSMKRRARERAARVEGAIGGDSVFTLYASVDLEPAWFAQRSTGHFFYTSTRKGVGGDIFAQLRAILTDVESQTEKDSIRQQCEAWIRRYIDSTTYEISIPALKDPTLAPPGKTGLIISVLFDYELCKAAQAGGWYEDLKMLVENEMLDVLSATAYPRLKDAVIDRFSATPLSIERIAGTSEGAITGWAFTNPVIPAERRMQTVARSVKTDLPDVYQAGQWSYSPSGVPIAILTGKLAADRVIRDLRRAGKRGTGI
jgi:hypothetical protein